MSLTKEQIARIAKELKDGYYKPWNKAYPP